MHDPFEDSIVASLNEESDEYARKGEYARLKGLGGKVNGRIPNLNPDGSLAAIQTTATENAFCPTGEGNGQDNSCSPGGAAGGGKVKIDFSPSLKITNLDQLPRGVGAKAKYLEAVRGPDGSYIAKQWRERPPASYEVLIKMPPMKGRRR